MANQSSTLEGMLSDAFEGQTNIANTLLTFKAEFISLTNKLADKDQEINRLTQELELLKNAEAETHE